MKNLILNGDNIKGLNYLLSEKNLQGKIDLIYIDPPFATNGNSRKIIFADEKDGKKVQDIWAFKDPQYPNYPTEKKC